jgi:3'-phosphoadenosine 5'-phosphosulfate sulfotransferase (PAPS reductase)/FAD synthetase
LLQRVEDIRIVSVSGGKDSTAVYCWAIREFGQTGFHAVFADTGHEHPATLNYLRNLPALAGGPVITWVKADFSERLRSRGKKPSGNPFLDLMLLKGRAPSSKAQFCTEHLKMVPIRGWLESIRGDSEVHLYVGIRAGESLRRSRLPEKEFSEYYDGWVHRPILRWSEQDVFDFLARCEVPANPLYEAGFSRVGCFPCIHARKSELARLPDSAWNKLSEWESKIGRTWFPPGLVPGQHITTINAARAWCKTKRGGKEPDPHAPEAQDIPSCMATWGVCE